MSRSTTLSTPCPFAPNVVLDHLSLQQVTNVSTRLSIGHILIRLITTRVNDAPDLAVVEKKKVKVLHL